MRMCIAGIYTFLFFPCRTWPSAATHHERYSTPRFIHWPHQY